MIDTINGAVSSTIIYRIAETTKANNLKSFVYFEYLLMKIPKHTVDRNTVFFAEHLPWSKALPEHILKLKKAEKKMMCSLKTVCICEVPTTKVVGF